MVNIAVMGYGVVGSGVVEVIYKNAGMIAQNAARDIEVKYILDLRDFPDSPYGQKHIKDFSIIENDPEVSVVVEAMGGIGAAYQFTKRCFAAGKHVVTSNKELVATHGVELIHMARERNLNYLFEASVGGGIPIIRPLSQCLAANEITEICGILNGTTNYILTRMVKSGLSFEKALAEAQEKGYAEADPTADIEGQDTCRKICILSALAFGRHVYPVSVKTEGITRVTTEDMDYARCLGRSVKLLGIAKRTDDGKIYAAVAPFMIKSDKLIAGVEDVFNSIVVKGNVIDEVMFYGRGAGKLPTASAVVADIIDAAKHFTARKYLNWEDGGPTFMADWREMRHNFFVRAQTADADGAFFAAKEHFPGSERLERQGAPAGELAFVTSEMSEGAFADALEKLTKTTENAAYLRLMD